MADEISELIDFTPEQKQHIQDYIEAPLRCHGPHDKSARMELQAQKRALSGDIDNLNKIYEWAKTETQNQTRKRKFVEDSLPSLNNRKRLKLLSSKAIPRITIKFNCPPVQSSPSIRASNNNDNSPDKASNRVEPALKNSQPYKAIIHPPFKIFMPVLKAQGATNQQKQQPVDKNFETDNKFLETVTRIAQFAERHSRGRNTDIEGKNRYVPKYVHCVPKHVRAYQERVEETRKAFEEEVERLDETAEAREKEISRIKRAIEAEKKAIAQLEDKMGLDEKEEAKQTPNPFISEERSAKSKITNGRLQVIRQNNEAFAPFGRPRNKERDEMLHWTTGKKAAKLALDVLESKYQICALVKQIESIPNVNALLNEPNDKRPNISPLTALPPHIRALKANRKDLRHHHGDGYGTQKYFDDRRNWYQSTSKTNPDQQPRMGEVKPHEIVQTTRKMKVDIARRRYQIWTCTKTNKLNTAVVNSLELRKRMVDEASIQQNLLFKGISTEAFDHLQALTTK